MEDDVTQIEEDESTPIMSETSENGDTALDPLPVQGFNSQGLFSTPSIVDLFRSEQESLASAKSVFIAVKGYEQTGLQIRYRMPESGKELEILANRINRQYKDTYSRNLYVSMDTIILLCDGLYVQPEGVTEPVMLDPDEIGEPCGFDTTLAGLLGMDGEGLTARLVLRKLFGDNELAIITHAFDLNRWLQNTKADLNLEIWQVGE
jgi:hypothetical protein